MALAGQPAGALRRLEDKGQGSGLGGLAPQLRAQAQPIHLNLSCTSLV